MRVAKRTRFCVTLVLVVGLAALILGCERASKQSSPVAQVAQDEATQKTTANTPPIPEAGPLARIAGVGEYQQAFRRVFGRPPNGPDLLRAIASYERTQLSFDSPFDHFIAGDKNAIDAAAKRGWELFNTRGRCNKCHALTEEKRDVTNFTDNDFHNIGIGILRHNVLTLARRAEQLIN